jgi:hypothetical protein
MSAALPMSEQMTLWDTTSATSSPVSEGGPTPCASPDGPMTGPSGQALALANHSAVPGSKKVSKTSATCGLSSPSSLQSVALQSCLESRLRQRLDTVGSIEYSQTWKEKTTPVGLRYWAHTASAHRTSDKDCTGWQTPKANDTKGTMMNRYDENGLKPGMSNMLQDQVQLAGWGSPRASDGTHGGPNQGDPSALPPQVQLVGWHTPKANETNEPPGQHALRNADRTEACTGNLGEQAGLSSAATTSTAGFRLNPHFSRWLMGFPPEWCDCAVTAMQSFPKSRRRSSKPIVEDSNEPTA